MYSSCDHTCSIADAMCWPVCVTTYVHCRYPCRGDRVCSSLCLQETGTPEEQVDSDPEKRAVYWKMQRDKLLALKQEHREKYIERAMAEQEEKRPMTAAMAKRVVGNPSSLDTKDPSSSSEETNDEKEEKRKTLLKALAQRLKKDLAENLADSS